MTYFFDLHNILWNYCPMKTNRGQNWYLLQSLPSAVVAVNIIKVRWSTIMREAKTIQWKLLLVFGCDLKRSRSTLISGSNFFAFQRYLEQWWHVYVILAGSTTEYKNAVRHYLCFLWAQFFIYINLLSNSKKSIGLQNTGSTSIKIIQKYWTRCLISPDLSVLSINQ